MEAQKRTELIKTLEPSMRKINKCLFLYWTNTTSLEYFKQKMLLQMECEKNISLISGKQSWQLENFRC